ncbi:MAG: glycosyltransferase family 2 protein [Acidobacteria bacterium]|nr:glycosyltransferase family 2 protein [Acidobacteriota bacterium]
MSKELPFVTVVMPVRNESGYIERCLNAVVEQDYPAERMEIIIADGMSTDTTREIIQSFQSRFANIRLIDNPGKIAPTGLNRATEMAAGEIIARVDGHCEIAPDYISRAVEHLQNEEPNGIVDGVGGPIETIGETATAEVIAAAMSSAFGVGNSAFRTVKDKTMLADSIAFPVYTRLIIERAGGYDEELVRNQDDEYNYRLRKLGAKLLLAADVRSRYYSRGTMQKLFKQYFQYGFWKVRVLQKHPRQMSVRQFIPPAFVLSLLCSLCIAAISWVGWWIFAGIIGCYLTVNLLASVRISLSSSPRPLQFFLLPVVFASLHLSYGLGFLVGFVKFAPRWRMRK